MKSVFLISAVMAFFILSAPALAYDMKFSLQIDGITNSVYVPGSGEKTLASSDNSTFTAPEHRYIASYGSGILKSLISVDSNLIGLNMTKSSTTAHWIGLYTKDWNTTGASALLVFTKGDWRNIDEKIADVESGRFTSYYKPTFGFGIGNIYAIKILLSYSDIVFSGNPVFSAGRRGIGVYNNGTDSAGRQVMAISKES